MYINIEYIYHDRRYKIYVSNSFNSLVSYCFFIFLRYFTLRKVHNRKYKCLTSFNYGNTIYIRENKQKGDIQLS